MKKYIVCCIIRNAFNVYVREGESDGDGEQWTILVSSAINRKKISSELKKQYSPAWGWFLFILCCCRFIRCYSQCWSSVRRQQTRLRTPAGYNAATGTKALMFKPLIPPFPPESVSPEHTFPLLRA